MKNRRIGFRISAELKERIEEYAGYERRTVSDWIHLVLEERIQQLDYLADDVGIRVGF